MKKINWIFVILLAAVIIASTFSTAHSTFTDSLHFRLTSDTAVWNEELSAYTVDLDFQMKWDVPNEPITKIVAVINYNTSLFHYLSDAVDTANWPYVFGVVSVDSSSDLGQLLTEWQMVPPFNDSSWTTGQFVRYGVFTFCIADQSSRIEGGVAFKQTFGNKTRIIRSWDMIDSNYVDGSPVFLGITETPCCNSPGDANNNGQINISDVTFVIARIFAGGGSASVPG